MKMFGEIENNSKAHKVCEDLLSICKSSKLNYLVKETPYSAYITIRKRFVKETDLSDVTLVPRDESDNTFRRENLILKERCRSLEVDLEYLKIGKENLQLEYEQFKLNYSNVCKEAEQIKSDLDDAKIKIVDLNEALDNKTEDNTNSVLGKEFLQVQIRKIQTKNDQMTKTLNEKDDDVAILDNTLKNRDLEIARLREELNAEMGKSEIEEQVCEHCNLFFKKNVDLESHITESHTKKCDSCGEHFVGDRKFKTHTCRIQIRNPSSEFLYMKNWYIKDSCISVFSAIKKKEVIVLHSSHCVNKQLCSVCPRGLMYSIRVVDKGLIHLNAYCVVKSGEVNWDLIDFESEEK